MTYTSSHALGLSRPYKSLLLKGMTVVACTTPLEMCCRTPSMTSPCNVTRRLTDPWRRTPIRRSGRSRRDDVNIAEASLLVRHGKNGRHRHVPIHTTSAAALSAYAAQRDRLCPRPTTPSFLVSTRGRRLAHSSVQAVFATLRRQSGLEGRGQRRLPRLHDLRNAFVVRTMLAWHRDGLDVQARLPLLSTYVGHVDPKATYWYQQAAPELLALAARRREAPPGDDT